MSNRHVRVRFAPSPTGKMHLGNVRTALLNYLFARQKDGCFIVRIEDTDPERNVDPNAERIVADLGWLDLSYDEGPVIGGSFEPYFQSQRMSSYNEKLNYLIEKNLVYRCFCTNEELEKKRQRQIALRTAPRYDRTCLKLSEQEIQQRIDENVPFIWRIKLDHEKKVVIHDIAHGTIEFELKNFSDFALSRQNGTFTFMFANFVDDMVMEISHVLRGEDHLSNTAGQAALYQAFEKELPTFWHLPILCNTEGKKLSKRDFGFSLEDLKKEGYLPEAICNYLAIIGGSFEQEIMHLDELTQVMNFDHAHARGQIKYDVEKLRWVNRKWISHYDTSKLATLCRPFLEEAFPSVKQMESALIIKLVRLIQTDIITLKDVVVALAFYFRPPEISKKSAISILKNTLLTHAKEVINLHHKDLPNMEVFLNNAKKSVREKEFQLKEFFSFIRFALIGTTKGPGVGDLCEILGNEEAASRIQHLLDILK